MSKINIDLDKLKNENGNYNGSDVEAIEKLTGKPFKEVCKEAKKNETPEKPDKPVSKWSTTEKIEFVNKYGRQEFEKLF